MKLKLFKRIFLIFILLFIIIFAARAVYNLNTSQDTDVTPESAYFVSSNSASLAMVKNYASERVEYSAAGADSVIDQKYERVASITSKTTDYDSDLSRFQNVLNENKAVVQSENSRGLPGSRRVDLVIGVRPDNFDQMRDEILKIGRIISSTTTKVDKTYEYRQMTAEMETLQNRKASYETLKERGGSITELLEVEDKIIDVDTQIEQQQIGLGEYSDENALCTINFSLYEGSAVSVSRGIWSALTWSAEVYAVFAGIVILIGLAAFIILHVWVYLRKTLEPHNVQSEEKTDKNR